MRELAIQLPLWSLKATPAWSMVQSTMKAKVLSLRLSPGDKGYHLPDLGGDCGWVQPRSSCPKVRTQRLAGISNFRAATMCTTLGNVDDSLPI